MKKYLFFIIIVGIAILLVGKSWFLKIPIKNSDSQGKNIICFGNSLTAGEGADSGLGFPELLQKEIERPVFNAGQSGETTAEALLRLQKDVLEKEPYLALVEFGANDFLKNVPKEETIKNLEQIIEKIQDKGAIVVLLEVRTGYTKDFKKLAKKYQLLLVPNLLQGILTNPELKTDAVHPNDKGYEIIAKRILEEIKPYLK